MSAKTLRFGPVVLKSEAQCGTCKGKGEVYVASGEGKDAKSQLVQCGKCGGEGVVEIVQSVFNDIPEGTRVRIEALPGRNVVYDGRAARSLTVDLDPGKYAYSMVNFVAGPSRDGPGRVERVQGEFLLDMTEQQFRTLRMKEPKMARGRQTSEGARWLCGVPGCRKQLDSRVAAYLHECRDHLGIDPLASPDKAAIADAKASELVGRLAASKGAEPATP